MQNIPKQPGVPPYEVKTRRCTIHPGRYRWDIWEPSKSPLKTLLAGLQHPTRFPRSMMDLATLQLNSGLLWIAWVSPTGRLGRRCGALPAYKAPPIGWAASWAA